MGPLLYTRRSLIINISGSLFQLLLIPVLSAQVAGFIAQDTVCTGQQFNIINTSTGGTTWYWNFCSGNALSNPVGVNIGNPGNLLNIPCYSTLLEDGGICYSFITNQGSASVVRYNHGTSFSNNPVSWTNLGGFGMLTDTVEGIKICSDNGQWIGFINNNNRIVRLNFGASLANTPVATLLGPYSMLYSAHCLDIFNEGGIWVGYITCSMGNKMVRLNFGNSLMNTPVLTDLGAPGSLNIPGAFRFIKESGIWYGLVVNMGNNTLTRLTFGNSLLNNPAGVNLGIICPGINPGGISLISDCGGMTGFQLNYSTTSTDLIWRLNFPSGITGPVTGVSLGNIGAMSRPSLFSELFRVGDTLFLYNTNRQNFTLTRLRFLPCTNASVPSSVLFNPPSCSYNQPGTYNIQLIMNEGLPTQISLCKSIVVVPPPANIIPAFTAPDTVYTGAPVNIVNQTVGGTTWYWSFCSGNALSNPVGVNIGNPGGLLSIPTYITLVKQGNECFSFISCQGVGVIRYYHGTSFANDPVSWTNLGQFGMINFNEEGIQVKYENGNWYGFVNSFTTIIRLDFGNSLWNTPTAHDIGPFSSINHAHGLVITQEGTAWVGFVTSSTDQKLVRLDFGTSLTNLPVATDFGSLGGVLIQPYAICLVQENALWYAIIMAGGNTLARITFGTSLFNPPIAVNLGNPGGFNSALGLTLLRDCESTTGYWTNYIVNGELGKLIFPSGITGPVTGTVLGNIGNLNRPTMFSEIFRQNDTLYTYISNRDNATLTRLTFPPCTNASVPSSTLFNPPSYSYNQPGTYNIQLIVNEGLPTQASLCKNIVVIPPPTNITPVFTVPDTVCTGLPVNIVNQTVGGTTWYWNFCSGNTLSNPVGVNIGNPGNLMDIPGYLTLVKDGGTCYSFITTHGINRVVRYNHGTSFSNNPVSWTGFGNLGVISDTVQGIRIRNDNGQWIGLINDNNKIVRLNFGTSLANTPVVSVLGPFTMYWASHGLEVLNEGGTWIAFLACTLGNKFVRLNFGNSLMNSPVLTDLGLPGSMNMPSTLCMINENGIWYALVVNYGNNTITRLSFGTSLLNTPVGVNLGVVCSGITAAGIALIRDCENTTGFQLNGSNSSPNLIWRLNFPAGITGPVTGISLGNIGAMSQPLRFSELFRVGDTLFLYNSNRLPASLTRLRFMPCSNASAPSSVLFIPPTYSYNQPGTYNIQLIVDEGLPDQGSLCKSIVVMPPPVVNLGSDRTICPGTSTTLDAGAGFTSYLWSTGATTRTITVVSAGNYWAKVTRYSCVDYDTIAIFLYPVTPVNLGTDPTICSGQTTTFDAGTCPGCMIVWSNLTLGLPNIGSGQTYTTGIAGVYSVTVTTPDGCITRDTIQLFTNPAPTLTNWPLTQTSCSGSQVVINLVSGTPATNFSWTATASSPAVTGWSSGVGTTISQDLQNSSLTDQTVTYHITPFAGSCTGPAADYIVTVKPLPDLTVNPSSQSVCNGSNVSFTLSSGISGVSFSWLTTGSSGAISGNSPGNGSSVNQTLYNSGSTIGSVTYEITAIAGGCAGTPVSYIVPVMPAPDVIANPSSQTICSGASTSISLSSSSPLTTFSWLASLTSGNITGYTSGVGASVSQVLTNNQFSPGDVTYAITASIGTCISAALFYSVTVNPDPVVIISPYPGSICSGEPFIVSFSSATSGASFSWSASGSSPLVSGYSSGSGNSINQVLENQNAAAESVSYFITPAANGCIGSSTTLGVFIKPLPDVTYSPAFQSVCYGQPALIALSSSFSGAICSWTATGSSPAVTGYSDGMGNIISQILFTTGTTTRIVTYTVTSSLGGCTGLPAQAQVMTYPVPDVTATPSGQSVCSGKYTAIMLQSQLSGTTYQWNASGTANITGYSGGTSNAIVQLLSNSSNTQGSVIYLITPSVSTCAGTVLPVTVVVYPHPPVSFTICTDSVTTLSARPFLLHGGLPPGGLYSGPGVDSVTGSFNPSWSGTGLHPITYSYSNVYGCKGTHMTTIHVLPASSFFCDGNLTDVRDNHHYSTFLLPNGKCWMMENLDFGYQISDLIPQTDNCISEKYLVPNSATARPQSAYQWDELMQYEPVAGSRGLCPPEWHVPSSAEWEELLDLNRGASQAGGPLKDLYLLYGFHAIPLGLNYLNREWDFGGLPLSGSFFWTSTGSGSTWAIARGLNDKNPSVSFYYGSRANAFSVRCIKDQ